ncbi:MAG: FtsB family cell division protein [Acidimicrobiia bacterium]
MNADVGSGGAKGPHQSRRASWEQPTRIAVASLAVIAIMFLFVFPTRSYLAQQRQVRGVRRAVAELKAQNAELGNEARLLGTTSEIERLARFQFDMVFPGEQAYNVVPPAKPSPATNTTLP